MTYERECYSRKDFLQYYLQANCEINHWHRDKQDLPGDNGEYHKSRTNKQGRCNKKDKAAWDFNVYDTQIRRDLHMVTEST
jgi:hypothetical protein